MCVRQLGGKSTRMPKNTEFICNIILLLCSIPILSYRYTARRITWKRHTEIYNTFRDRRTYTQTTRIHHLYHAVYSFGSDTIYICTSRGPSPQYTQDIYNSVRISTAIEISIWKNIINIHTRVRFIYIIMCTRRKNVFQT